MALSLVTAPTSEPVTLAEAKAQLRVDISDDDDYITGLIVAARELAETQTRRQLMPATWRLSQDSFVEEYQKLGPSFIGVQINPMAGLRIGPYQLRELRIPLPPLQSITSFTYLDTAGNSQSLTLNTDYIVDTYSEPARVVPAYSKVWPATRDQLNAVTIVFVAGYASAAAIPAGIKQAMKMLISHWYEHREAVSDIPMASIPVAVDRLLYAASFGSYV